MTARRAESLIRSEAALDRGVDLAAIEVRLGRAVEAAARKASMARAPRVASVTIEVAARDPIALLGAAGAGALRAALWMRPDEGLGLVGIGEAWAFDGDGRSRIADAGKAWSALVRDAVCDRPADAAAPTTAGSWGVGPIAVGGFAFDHRTAMTAPWLAFGRASLTLPRVTVRTTGHGSAVTANVVVRPGHDTTDAIGDALATLSRLWRETPAVTPPEAGVEQVESLVVEELRPVVEWRSIVAEAAAAVRRAELRKVVVARGVRVRTGVVDPARVLGRLRAEYPSCTVFALSRSGRDGEHQWFVGATPERLVRARAGLVTAMALAGSAPRGASEDEDRHLGDTLLASAKDRVEHSLVVDVMREALTATCEAVEIHPGPSLLKLSNVQHLHTPMAARMRHGTSVLDLVDGLHPTPAVGGVPRDDAIAWLRRHEGLDRGWYAGPIGWIDRHGEGEFSVAIRSALLGGGEALLYTGCGIVADSVPAFEYAESRLKLRPMLTALGAGVAT